MNQKFADFLRDFRLQATQRGENEIGFSWDENPQIHFEIIACHSDGVELGFIGNTGDRGVGNASKALDWCLSLADKHGLPVHLFVCPLPEYIGERCLDSFQLAEWYASRGFVGTSGDRDMVRQPKVLLT